MINTVEGKRRIWEILVLTEWFADDPVGYRRGIGKWSFVYRYPATGRTA